MKTVYVLQERTESCTDIIGVFSSLEEVEKGMNEYYKDDLGKPLYEKDFRDSGVEWERFYMVDGDGVEFTLFYFSVDVL